MVQSLEETIDGIAFTVQEFPAMKAIHTKARILAIVGPSIAKLLEVFDPALLKKDFKVADFPMEKLGPVLEVLIGRLKPDDFTSLCVDLFKGTIAITPEHGKVELAKGEAAFNMVFTGQIETMYKALFLVLKANRFFGLASIGKLAGTFAKPTTPSTPGSEPPKAS